MFQRVIACSLGLLLLTSAGLKLYGLSVSPFAQYGRLMNPSVQFAAVEWEIVLGLWLVSGRAPVAAWFAALLTFLVFAAVSLYLGVIGQASCGCFGSVNASPWHALAVDAAALALLFVGRPSRQFLAPALGEWRRQASRWAGWSAGAVATCALVGVVVSLVFGSPAAALARLRGERVSVRPRPLDVGSGEPGQRLAGEVEVTNWSDRAVQIAGGTSDCSCVTTADLPLTLAAGESRRIPVEVRLPTTPGLWNRKAMLWTDCGEASFVLFELTGYIQEAREGATGRPEK